MTFEEECQYFLDRFLLRAWEVQKRTMDYEPLKITFYLSAPITLNAPWMLLDGLVGHLLFTEAMGEDYFYLPRKFPFSRLLRGADLPPFPIKQTGELTHCSVSLFDTEKMGLEIMYKKFEDRWAPGQKKISIGSGWFRNYMMQHIYIPTRTVRFYACADKETLERIFPRLQGLGNDYRVGWGAIRDFEIEPEKEDRSIKSNGVAMRPIPLWMLSYAGETVALPWRPPYWAKENVDPCCPPFVECALIGQI